jgi:hypothetical protein
MQAELQHAHEIASQAAQKQQQKAEEEAATAAADLKGLREQHKQVAALAEQQAARLQQLEGECVALCPCLAVALALCGLEPLLEVACTQHEHHNTGMHPGCSRCLPMHKSARQNVQVQTPMRQVWRTGANPDRRLGHPPGVS